MKISVVITWLKCKHYPTKYYHSLILLEKSEGVNGPTLAPAGKFW